ncbi:hypothetical protein MCUN1_002171 [Malassezia cuniculi]|uniref:Peptidase S1 domain-containing protein n=1 Tax=Malassezia cuniculi TaxID=948313 RepID=A0AAF0ERM8_9BASI|nr:hypothetical protein MCUN1_002171 [Malassezia cuniculi]
MKFTALLKIASVISVLASPAMADEIPRTQQPSTEGSVLHGHLSAMNENGAYFANRPYKDNAVNRPVSQLVAGGALCTASVIHTAEKSFAITAAHCVSKAEGSRWVLTDSARQGIAAGHFRIAPAFDGTATEQHDRTPYGAFRISEIYLSEDSNADVALLRIAPNDNNQNVEDLVRGFDIHDPIESGQVVQASLIGYPGPAPFNGNSQSVCVGHYTLHHEGNDGIRRVSTERECWVGGGSSGGPFVARSNKPGSPGSVLTVLHSSGGANVPVVIRAIAARAGATLL